MTEVFDILIGRLWVRLDQVDSNTARLRNILLAMTKGEDVWEEFLDLVGPFILHILKEDYCFYEEYDEHSRQEVLHDIYLRVAKYAGKTSSGSFEAYKGYLRKIIRTVISNKRRVVKRWRRELSLEEVTLKNPDIGTSLVSDTISWFEDYFDSRTIKPTVLTAIKNVSGRSHDPEKTALILENRILDEAGYTEISAAVGMDVDAVRHVVHYYGKSVITEAREMLGRN